jgi:hypothetical protein
MADPLRDCQPEAQAKAEIVARAALDRDPLRMKAAAGGRRDEVRSFRQAPDQACA